MGVGEAKKRLEKDFLRGVTLRHKTEPVKDTKMLREGEGSSTCPLRSF